MSMGNKNEVCSENEQHLVLVRGHFKGILLLALFSNDCNDSNNNYHDSNNSDYNSRIHFQLSFFLFLYIVDDFYAQTKL